MTTTVINQLQKMESLVEELGRSREYEKCTHHLVMEQSFPRRYFLVEIKSGKIVSDGRPNRIASYKRLRAIENSQIFDYHLLANHSVESFKHY
jgi:hypothetical protein